MLIHARDKISRDKTKGSGGETHSRPAQNICYLNYFVDFNKTITKQQRRNLWTP
jgi:hypothetical protein